MDPNKKYTVISDLTEDAPYGSVNWCSISFLTPQRIDGLESLDIIGFKVHNGYNSSEIAGYDVERIKESNSNHDVFVTQIGKIHPWDDANSSNNVTFSDEKLNALEQTRRESIDKIKLMREQFKNEYTLLKADEQLERIEKMKARMREKLHREGKITKQELEMMNDEEKPRINEKKILADIESIKVDIESCQDVDYLDENKPVAFKFGCITIYSPKKIGGLRNMCFKVRGLFQTRNELTKRIRKLVQTCPNDQIFSFEIGKWCPYTDACNMSPVDQMKQLNYAMMKHLNNVETETAKYLERKENLVNKTEQAVTVQKARNRRERRAAERSERKTGKVNAVSTDTNDTDDTNDKSIGLDGNADTDKDILDIANFLDDPELRNKYPASSTTTTTIDI